MERPSPKGRTLVLQQAGAVAEAPKPRKKLQKGASKQRNQVAKRSEPLAPNEAARNKRWPSMLGKPTLPLPPALGDSKWSEYLRSSVGYVPDAKTSPEPEEPSKPARKPDFKPVDKPATNSPAKPQAESSSKPPSKPPANFIIPEFSHLVSSRETLQPPPDRMSPGSSASSTSTMRRRAKTPVFSIGQLEASDSSKPRHNPVSEPTPSLESIAEQYRALIGSRNSLLAESPPGAPPTRQEGSSSSSFEESRRHHTVDDVQHERIRIQVAGRPLIEDVPPGGSPTMRSDDGTLVGFEEERVYFKPVSFSPGPFSSHDLPLSLQRSPSIAPPDNLSLQICVDLLTRELSSVLMTTSRPPQRNLHPTAPLSDSTSALQVLIMIEAYERLRDKLVEGTAAQLNNDETQHLGTMFDVWLRTLYKIHESFTGGDGRLSESDYGAEDMG